jgi:hypothetical protein
VRSFVLGGFCRSMMWRRQSNNLKKALPKGEQEDDCLDDT